MITLDFDAPDKPGRRVVVLEASWATQEALREWAIANGFDLGWSHSGWPQRVDDFRFHVTVIATENAVSIPPSYRGLGAVTLRATGFGVLGGSTPVIELETHDVLRDVRALCIEKYGAKPTYVEYIPHISLSYKWTGAPSLDALTLPDFPLTFDALVVAELSDPVQPVGDGAAASVLLSVEDRATVSGARRTRDGYLVADARVARTGIQEYHGYEVGKPELSRVSVYRPESEVFAADALRTYAYRPVTVGHPTDGVTPSNWRTESVGTTGAEVARDGEYVRVPLVLMDADAIQAVESGLREISMGYACRLDWTPGVTPDGIAYDAVQRGLQMNHLAIVEQGRAGSACRIGDGGKRAAVEQEKTTMPKLTVDGIDYDLSDQGVQLVKKLQGDVAALQKRVADADTAVADATKARDAAVGERDAFKYKIPTADALDTLVADRAALVSTASKMCPGQSFAGMTADAIRAHVVKAKLGDSAVKERSVEYIGAAFDTLAGSTGTADPVADALRSSHPAQQSTNVARANYLQSTADAWMPAGT